MFCQQFIRPKKPSKPRLQRELELGILRELRVQRECNGCTRCKGERPPRSSGAKYRSGVGGAARRYRSAEQLSATARPFFASSRTAGGGRAKRHAFRQNNDVQPVRDGRTRTRARLHLPRPCLICSDELKDPFKEERIVRRRFLTRSNKCFSKIIIKVLSNMLT